jgi:hypothetical protein
VGIIVLDWLSIVAATACTWGMLGNLLWFVYIWGFYTCMCAIGSILVVDFPGGCLHSLCVSSF